MFIDPIRITLDILITTWLIIMEINHRDLRDHKIIAPKGDLDYFSCKELREVIFSHIQDKTKNIILDLRDVPFIDSAGMGLLITASKELSKINGTIGLLNPSKEILDLMVLATLDKVIRIYDNEDAIP